MSLALLLLSAAAASAPVSILGLEISRPLAFTECRASDSYLRYVSSLKEKKLSRRLDEPLFAYASPTNSPCYQRRHDKFAATPASNEVVNIIFPSSPTLPVMVEAQTIEAVVINGLVEFVAFETPGFQVQDSILATLKEKFGGPVTLEPMPLQNGFGAKFEGMRAVWHPSVSVTATYTSFAPNMMGDDRGNVRIGTAAGVAAYDADYAARLAPPPSTLKL